MWSDHELQYCHKCDFALVFNSKVIQKIDYIHHETTYSKKRSRYSSAPAVVKGLKVPLSLWLCETPLLSNLCRSSELLHPAWKLFTVRVDYKHVDEIDNKAQRDQIHQKWVPTVYKDIRLSSSNLKFPLKATTRGKVTDIDKTTKWQHSYVSAPEHYFIHHVVHTKPPFSIRSCSLNMGQSVHIPPVHPDSWNLSFICLFKLFSRAETGCAMSWMMWQPCSCHGITLCIK